MAAIAAQEEEELRRREHLYRGNERALDITGKRVILVDDGLATGASMLAAVRALRGRNAGHIVVAVPVGSSEACADLRHAADIAVCAESPEPFFAVGAWYHDFKQTTDEDVRALLVASRVDVPALSAAQ